MSACCNALFTPGLWAIAKRQLGSFLANPLGYIFILLFVLACAALRCVGGQFKGRLLFRNEAERSRARKWGITDLDKQYDISELAKGDVIFAATGVTDGSLLAGVKRLKGGRMTTESVVMRASSGTVRWVRGEHRKHG